MKTITLTRGYEAIVDDDDYDELIEKNWCISSNRKNGKRYAVCTTHPRGERSEYMHRVIMKAPKGKHIDHINSDGLDNRKCNLRFCNNSQNHMNVGLRSDNTSGYKGVSYSKGIKKWSSKIWKDGKSIFLGYFDDKDDAARAYNRAAESLFGDFASLNKI